MTIVTYKRVGFLLAHLLVAPVTILLTIQRYKLFFIAIEYLSCSISSSSSTPFSQLYGVGRLFPRLSLDLPHPLHTHTPVALLLLFLTAGPSLVDIQLN